jgi:hypothetical protein
MMQRDLWFEDFVRREHRSSREVVSTASLVLPHRNKAGLRNAS